MTEAARLRFGILAALASSGVLAALSASGCGSDVSTSGKAAGSGSNGAGGGSSTSAGVGGESSTSASATGAGGTVSTSTGNGGVGNAPPPDCNGQPPVQECYTLDHLEYVINNPPVGGDEPRPPGPDRPDAGVELTECPEPALVQNDCCNHAMAGPVEQADLCCYWFCDGACCGRPYVIDGRARIAAATPRGDWLVERAPSEAEALDEPTRAALAAAWLRDAQMEHASIASFARFTLELLALGAPPELVGDSQRASLDEIEHARACFAQATRFAGDAVGPAPLDIGSEQSSSQQRSTLASCAVAAVREGCIGETIAAFVARQQLAVATDPSVRRALARIAADEERHAALSWRFVRWAIATGGAPLRAAVIAAFEHGLRGARSAPVEPVGVVDAAAWQRFGRLTEEGMRAATVLALDEVIRPCAEALLGPDDAPRA
jgi:hypothetical protein